MKLLNKIKSIVRHPIKFLNALKFFPFHKADLKRWKNIENLHKEWDERTMLIAKLIPSDSAVLEFGAARLVLREHLAENCIYQPSDIVDRGENTIVCDLNVDFPFLKVQYSHVVFSGVLEYLIDIEKVLKSIKKHNENVVIIASYATTDKVSDYVTRLQNGWINHYSDDELLEIFKTSGFKFKNRYTWRLQTIYVFE